jgi:hypothetical protein
MQRLSKRPHVGNYGTRQKQTLFESEMADSGHALIKKELMAFMRFWSDLQTPMPYVAPFSSMVMILGGDEGVIERARATWGGVYVPRRTDDRSLISGWRQ